MVQSWNTKGIVTFFWTVLRKPYLLIPHMSVKCVNDIPFHRLRNAPISSCQLPHQSVGTTTTTTTPSTSSSSSFMDHHDPNENPMNDNYNIQMILFDKDNTLTVPYDNQNIHEHAQRGLEQAISLWGISRIAILSNSAGTDDDIHEHDAIEIERQLGISVIRHHIKKPGNCLPEIYHHFRRQQQQPSSDTVNTTTATTELSSSQPQTPEQQQLLLPNDNVCNMDDHTIVSYDNTQICMIGDRLLTDIVFGNIHGMYTIHIQEPLSIEGDNKIAIILRSIENWLLYRSGFIRRYLYQLQQQKQQQRLQQKRSQPTPQSQMQQQQQSPQQREQSQQEQSQQR